MSNRTFVYLTYGESKPSVTNRYAGSNAATCNGVVQKFELIEETGRGTLIMIR